MVTQTSRRAIFEVFDLPSPDERLERTHLVFLICSESKITTSSYKCVEEHSRLLSLLNQLQDRIKEYHCLKKPKKIKFYTFVLNMSIISGISQEKNHFLAPE